MTKTTRTLSSSDLVALIPEASHVFADRGIDRNVTAAFFALFARFEAALKRASFIRSDRREVQADWEEFGDSLLGSFAAAPGSPVADAVSYLELNPPQKQVLENGEVRWREARRLAPYSSRNAFV